MRSPIEPAAGFAVGDLRWLGLLLGGLLVAAACRPPTQPGRTSTTITPAKLPARLTIFYSCDTRGHIEPCACSGGHEGGLPRRATCLSRQSRPVANRLLVDAGDMIAGPREWERFEYQYLLGACQLLGYDALNAGWREAGLDLDALRQFARLTDRLISANLVASNGQPVLPPFRVASLPDGSRAGILGVLEDKLPAAQLGRGLRLLPAADAIARHLPALKAQSDFQVLLAFADEPQLQELANRFYEFRVIIGGRVPQSSPQALAVNRSWIVHTTDKGKRLGRLDLVPDPSGATAGTATNEIFTLGDSLPDQPELQALVADYNQQLKARGFPTTKTEDDEGLSLIGAPPPPERKP